MIREILGIAFLAMSGLFVGMILGKSAIKDGPMDDARITICLFVMAMCVIGFVWGGMSLGWI